MSDYNDGMGPDTTGFFKAAANKERLRITAAKDAEIARLRELLTALLDELEKARATLSCGHHHSLEIRSVESDYRACELCEARAQQRDAEAMESKYRAERDEARQRIRELEGHLNGEAIRHARERIEKDKQNVHL